jgi:hypothetical protein
VLQAGHCAGCLPAGGKAGRAGCCMSFSAFHASHRA